MAIDKRTFIRGWSTAALVMAGLAVSIFRDFIFPSEGRVLSLFGDFPRQFFPWRLYASRVLAKGDWPLWDPYSGCGNDFVARLETALFYPLNLFLGWACGEKLTISGYQIFVFAHYALYGFILFSVLRLLGLVWPAALFAGICGVGCSFLIPWAHAPTLITTACWIPLALYFFHQYLKNSQMVYSVAGGACLGITLLGGHAQLTVYAGLSVVLLWVAGILFFSPFSKSKWVSSFLGLILFFITAAGLSAIQWLPTLHLTLESARITGGLSYAAAGSLSLSESVHRLMTANTFLGILPLGLAIIGLAGMPGFLPKALTMIGAMGFLYALGTNSPVMPWMIKVIPGLTLFRFADRSFFLVNLSLFLLAGFGVHFLWQGIDQDSRERRRFYALGGLLGAAFVLTFWRDSLFRFLPWLPLILLLSLPRTSWRKKVTRTGVLLLVVGGLLAGLLWGNRVLPKNEKFPPEQFYALNDKVRWLQKQEFSQSPFRVVKQGYLTNYDPSHTDPKQWPSVASAGLVHRIETVDIAGELIYHRLRQFHRLTRYNPRLLDLMNVRYQIVLGNQDSSGLKAEGKYGSFILEPRVNHQLQISDLYPQPLKEIIFTFTDDEARKLMPGMAVADLQLLSLSHQSISYPLLVEAMPIQDPALDPKGRSSAGDLPHSFLGRIRLPQKTAIQLLEIKRRGSEGVLRIEKIFLDGTSFFDLGRRWSEPHQGIWENRWAFPRAFLVHTYLLATDQNQAESALRGLEPSQAVVLEERPPAGNWGQDHPKTEWATLKTLTAEKVLVETSLTSPGFLVLTDTYDTNWQAFEGERPLKILRANSIFRAIALGPGVHKIVFVYKSWWLRLGSLLTILTMVGLFFCFLIGFKKFSSRTETSPYPRPWLIF